MKMEPTASGTAAGYAGLKFLGAMGVGAALGAVVVMLMTPPRSPKEWAVGLISTVMGSICGGAAVIQYFGLQSWMTGFSGLLGVLGIAFACGLPAWAIVRWIFTYIQNRQGKDFAELVKEAKDLAR